MEVDMTDTFYLAPQCRLNEIKQAIISVANGQDVSAPPPGTDEEKFWYDIYLVTKGQDRVYNLPINWRHQAYLAAIAGRDVEIPTPGNDDEKILYDIVKATKGEDPVYNLTARWRQQNYLVQMVTALAKGGYDGHDLTGTTWVWNDVPTVGVAESIIYKLTFSSNSTDYSMIKLQTNGNIAYLYTNEGGTTINNTAYKASTTTWMNAAYKTISITGGDDATNAALIAIIEANATLQE